MAPLPPDRAVGTKNRAHPTLATPFSCKAAEAHEYKKLMIQDLTPAHSRHSRATGNPAFSRSSGSPPSWEWGG